MQYNPPRRCVEINSEEGLHAIRANWEDLFDHRACDSIFTSWDWVYLWWKHLGANLPNAKRKRLCIIVCSDQNGNVIGIAPLYECASWCSKLGGRRLIPIGTMAEGYGMTEEPPLLLRAGMEIEALNAIVDHLMSSQSSLQWNHFHLPVACASSAMAEVHPRGIARASTIHSHSCSGSEIVDLPDSWQAFRAGLSKSMKDNLAYYVKRLAKDGHTWTLRIATTPDEVDSAGSVLRDLHCSRAGCARGLPHQNHLPTATHADLMKEALALLSAKGMAFVVLLDIDGVTVAAQSFFEVGDTLFFYYSGFDPAWYDYSPMMILQAEIIKKAISDGKSRLNFFPSVHGWKARWGARQEFPILEISGFSVHPLAYIDSYYRNVHGAIASWLSLAAQFKRDLPKQPLLRRLALATASSQHK